LVRVLLGRLTSGEPVSYVVFVRPLIKEVKKPGIAQQKELGIQGSWYYFKVTLHERNLLSGEG